MQSKHVSIDYSLLEHFQIHRGSIRGGCRELTKFREGDEEAQEHFI